MPSRRIRWAAAGGSGLLLGLSYPPFPFAPLAWIALVPLLLVWERQESARASMVDAFVAFLATFAVAFHWPLFHAFHETALLSLPGLLIVPMWMAVPFALGTVFRKRLGPASGLAALVGLFVLMEFALRRGPLAVPWSLLGHTQAEFYPVNQLAALGGVPLLTVLVLAANCLFLTLIRSRVAATLAGASLMILAMPSPFPQSDPDAAQSLRVGIVQPAVPAVRWADIDDATRVRNLMRVTERIPEGVDLVLWPETALPPSASVTERVNRWSSRRDVHLIAGAIIPAEVPGLFYNAALLFSPERSIDVYRKERLVPFAEHVPFQDRWPWMRNLSVPSGGVRGYVQGTDNRLFEIEGTLVGVQICFETLFDDSARSYAVHGADLIVSITQDGWWGDSFGYRQHLAFTRLRAIETNLPIVQSSVSGISALIMPDGRVTSAAGWMDETAMVVSVPERSGQTVYTQLGDWITLLALGFVLILTLRIGIPFRR